MACGIHELAFRILSQKVETQTDAETKEEMSAYGKVKVKSLSHVQLFATPWTRAYQAPPSMGFFRQEYWSGLPFPSPGDLLNPGIEPGSPALQTDGRFTIWDTREAQTSNLNATDFRFYPEVRCVEMEG